MEAQRTSLGQNVFLTYLPAEKFKTGVLSAQFVTPMRRDTASAYALIPSVLRRGTVSCPDMGALAEKLDRLYGARIDATVRKIGERQCVGFVASVVDDRFVPGGERLLEPVAELLGELVCNPVTDLARRFVSAFFESEQANLLDAIRSQMNDKREWAARRLLEEMCAREPYGIPRLGDERHVEKLGSKSLFNRYRKLISTARLELVYCGSAERSRVEDALRRAFAALPREDGEDLAPAAPHAPRKSIRSVTDAMDVTQGKLSMGFSCTSDDFPALLLGNSIFGGNSNSKLFLNVREKLSLCYYASSVYHRQKRLVTVASGIEFANYEKAYSEILAQLEAVRAGSWEDWELDGARGTMLNAYASLGDSQGKLENFYLSQAALDLHETPESLAAQVREVTPERIAEAMGTVRLDTVYFLTGKDAASGGGAADADSTADECAAQDGSPAPDSVPGGAYDGGAADGYRPAGMADGPWTEHGEEAEE